MSSSEDILSVVFLALICIVIAGLVKTLLPDHSGLIVPSFVFISIALWIAYDYMMINRYKAKLECAKRKHEMSDLELEARINSLSCDMADKALDDNNIPDLEVEPEPNKPPVVNVPVKEHECEFDIDMHNQHSIKDMHSAMGASGDTRLCNRMKYMAVQAQLSQDIRSAWNKYSVQPWVEEELREQADREWWNSDHLDPVF